jgi:hypothetical protein
MAVDTPALSWERYAYERQLIADLNEGKTYAVKHIAKLPGWSGDPSKEELVQERAYYLPMVPRTVETFAGLVFLKAPRRVFPEGFEALTQDVTATGQEIDRFAEQQFDAVLNTGAIAILTDYEQVPEGLSKAQAEAEGYRPFLRAYDGNSILEAKPGRVGGATKLVRVRLLESVEEEAPGQNDPYATEFVLQVRVLELTGGVYTQTVWRQEKGEWIAGPRIVPLMGGKPLNEIPIDFSNPRDGEPRPMKPPMADLAECSKSHLTNSASYEWALAWLGEPILFAAGFKTAQAGDLAIGASEAIISENENAKLQIVTASAENVSGLAEAMERKEKHAASLGARLLAEDPKAAITAETARIQRAGEAASVGAVANAVSQCLTNALKRLARWGGYPTEVPARRANGEPQLGPDGQPVVKELLYWLNAQIIPDSLSHEDIAGMLALVIAGQMSPQEFYAKLQEAEWVDAGKAYEDHAEEVAAAAVNVEDDDEEAANDRGGEAA